MQRRHGADEIKKLLNKLEKENDAEMEVQVI